jgi:hypothetical protein
MIIMECTLLSRFYIIINKDGNQSNYGIINGHISTPGRNNLGVHKDGNNLWKTLRLRDAIGSKSNFQIGK